MRFKQLHISIGIAILSVLLLFGGSSCNNSDDNIFKPNITIKGRLVTNCDNPMPVANKLLILETSGGFKFDDLFFCERGYKEIAKTFTNDNGEFEFIYDKQRCINILQISIQDTTDKNQGHHLPLVTYLRANKNDDIGGVYLATTKSYQYKVKTQNTFTSSDTLYYNLQYTGSGIRRDSTYSLVAGPFSNGQIISGFLFSGGSKIHDGIIAGQYDRYNSEIRWILKKNGVTFKGGYSKMLFTDACVINTVLLNFDD